MTTVQQIFLLLLGFFFGVFLVVLFHILKRQFHITLPMQQSHTVFPSFNSTKDSPLMLQSSLDFTPHFVATKAPTHHPIAIPTHQPTIQPSVQLLNNISTAPSRSAIEETIEDQNVFISLAVSAITSPSDIVLFSGKTTKRLLDRPILTLPSMVSLNGKVSTRTWTDIARLINATHHAPNYNAKVNKGVHVHNEHKFGDFLEHIIIDVRRKQTKQERMAPGGPAPRDIHRAMDLGQAPIVLTNSADENWGFLSTGIGTRTTKWINMTNHLLIHGANYDTVQHFLASDKVILIVCNTHVDPYIGAHEKIISLPLGISRKGPIFERALYLARMGVKKKTILQINNSGWGDRAYINRIVSEAFNGSVSNTYKGANTDEMRVRNAGRQRKQMKRNGNVQQPEQRRRLQHIQQSEHSPLKDHFLETAQAKFVLCPSGLGYDTYRLWETLLMGSIPVVESNAGFDRTYSSLPVLVVRNYSDLTPQLLQRAYPCFVRNAKKFQFHHLTESYWLGMIARAVSTGSIAHVVENHPPKNKFCNFLE